MPTITLERPAKPQEGDVAAESMPVQAVPAKRPASPVSLPPKTISKKGATASASFEQRIASKVECASRGEGIVDITGMTREQRRAILFGCGRKK